MLTNGVRGWNFNGQTISPHSITSRFTKKGGTLRKSTLLIAALSSASLLLRRSRRFGPIRALVLGALLEESYQESCALGKEETQVTARKPSLWQRLTQLHKPSSPHTRAPQ